MATASNGTASAVRALLSDPATHGSAVTVVETHAATVFLVGDRAFKLKKPVRFPFLDYSTLALREAACRREVAINRRYAPSIYLGVVPVTHSAAGTLAIGGDGEPVEWLVAMRRFDEARTLDRLLDAGPPPDRLVDDLARMIAEGQATAPKGDAARWIRDLADYVEQNDRAFRAEPAVFAPAAVEALTGAARRWHGQIADLLAERGRLGFVRVLHGDLHSGNVAMDGDTPFLFDAIEFDDAVATADLLYDAGFLVMDLDERGHRPAANRLVGRFLIETARRAGAAEAAGALARQVEGLAALPFFLMLRAAIRGKIAAARAGSLEGDAADAARAEARRYFEAAGAYLEPAEPALVAVGGLSGTGKSTLAAALAPRFGAAPGALPVRADVMRKLIAGVGETERLPVQSYTKAASRQVYGLMDEIAGAALAAGRSAVIDGVFADAEERRRVEAVAGAAEARFLGLWLEAPRAVLDARVGGRTGDASDADRAVVAMQADYRPGPIAWIRIDASGSAAETLDRAAAALVEAGVR